MTRLIRYYLLRLWRDIELPGLAVGLALLASMGFVGRGSNGVGWCFVLAISAGLGTWLPAWCFRDGEAELGLPFARADLYLARVLAGAGFLVLCLLLAVAVGLLVSQGHLSATLWYFLGIQVFLGIGFQLVGAHGALCRDYGAQFICFAGAGHCVVAIIVSGPVLVSLGGDADLAVAGVLAFFGVVVCMVSFAIGRDQYVTWELAPDRDGIRGPASTGGSPCPRQPEGDRHVRGDEAQVPGRADTPEWDHGRLAEGRAMGSDLDTTSRGRRPLSWAWLVLMRYGEFRPWLAILFLFMAFTVPWWFIRGRRGAEAAHLMFVYVILAALVPECLQLSCLPLCRRMLFRIVCLPVLLVFLALWLAVTPWVGQYHVRSSCWVREVQDDEIQTIDPRHAKALAFGASEVFLSDGSGYTRRATIDRSGAPASFRPYEFDASDPPSFAVHQAQRYFHARFNLVVPSAELREAYESAPREWLETVDKRYASTRRANMIGRHLTAVGLISLAALALARLCFSVMHLATRVRHVGPLAVVAGATACATVMALGPIQDVRLKAALAMICDIVFRCPMVCIGIWLVCCAALYLWIESAFEQLEPTLSFARKRRPGLGL